MWVAAQSVFASAAIGVIMPACGSNEVEPSAASPDGSVVETSGSDGGLAPDVSDAGALDARTCSAQALDRDPTWTPPSPWYQDKCTPAEVEQLVVACIEGDFSLPACVDFRAEHPECYTCAISLDTAPARGPIVLFESSSYSELNFLGCIANSLGDTSETSCGAAFGVADDCVRIACRGCLPIASQPDYEALSACFNRNDTAQACSTEIKIYQARCGATAVDASPTNPAAVCSSRFTARDYVALWCSTAQPSDGGADAADGGDAGL